MNSQKIFAGTSNPDLARKVSQKSKIPLGKIDIGTFADGEIDVWIQDDVNNSEVFIIQSNSPPINNHIVELALIADALRRSGAHRGREAIGHGAPRSGRRHVGSGDLRRPEGQVVRLSRIPRRGEPLDRGRERAAIPIRPSRPRQALLGKLGGPGGPRSSGAGRTAGRRPQPGPAGSRVGG